MQVKHAQAVSFFVALGFAKAPSWKPSAMQERLAALNEVVADPEFKGREGNLSKEDKKLKDAVLKAIEAKEEIVVESPASATSGKKAAKAEKKAEKKAAKKSAGPRDFSKSNKAKVYTAWMKSKKKEEDPAKLIKVTDGSIKESTIKQWLSWWKRGEALPAIATHGK